MKLNGPLTTWVMPGLPWAGCWLGSSRAEREPRTKCGGFMQLFGPYIWGDMALRSDIEMALPAAASNNRCMEPSHITALLPVTRDLGGGSPSTHSSAIFCSQEDDLLPSVPSNRLYRGPALFSRHGAAKLSVCVHVCLCECVVHMHVRVHTCVHACVMINTICEK